MEPKKHKRPSDENQQIARAVRPQLPRDASKNGQNCLNGKMPAGFISVWEFGTGYQTKSSPTSGGGKKVY